MRRNELLNYYYRYPDKFCEEILSVKLSNFQKVFLRCCEKMINKRGEKMKIVSGRCGDEVYWLLNKSSGVLKITGNGSMYHCRDDYDKDSGMISTAPWGIYANYIRSIDIDEGVTEIGMYAFSDCYNLTDVTIPQSVTKIGSFAFCNCGKLTNINAGNKNMLIEPCVFAYLGDKASELLLKIGE